MLIGIIIVIIENPSWYIPFTELFSELDGLCQN